MNNVFGKYIERKRKESNSSLRTFGRLCGISHTHIDSIEKGEDFRTGKPVRVTTETIDKIAQALHVNSEILYKLSLTSTAEHFEFFYDSYEREDIKQQSRQILDNNNETFEHKKEAALNLFKMYYSRSIEACKFSTEHISFDSYVSMLLNQTFWENRLPSDVYDALVAQYGKSEGIEEGKTYFIVNDKEDYCTLKCTDYEKSIIKSYRKNKHMQPAIDKLLSITEESNDYLMPVAAHNDNPSDEQQPLMQSDMNKLDKL